MKFVEWVEFVNEWTHIVYHIVCVVPIAARPLIVALRVAVDAAAVTSLSPSNFFVVLLGPRKSVKCISCGIWCILECQLEIQIMPTYYRIVVCLVRYNRKRVSVISFGGISRGGRGSVGREDVCKGSEPLCELTRC